jgi:hypothetical protein
MRHNLRQRTTAGLLALLAQTWMIALFTPSREQPVEQEAESMQLVFIQPMQVPEAAPPRLVKTPAANRNPDPATTTNRDRFEPSEPIESAAPPANSRAITVEPAAAPRIDWRQQMAIAARQAVEQQEELERDNPLDSKPRVLVLPADRGDEKDKVKVSRLDNGDVVTVHRLSDKLTVKCLHEHVPVWLTFDITAQHLPPKCYMMDTSPSLAPLVESAKPEYLRRPLPLPKQPQTPAQR